MRANLGEYLSRVPKYERAVHVAAVTWTGLALALQLVLGSTLQHLPAILVLATPGRYAAVDLHIDRSTLVTVGWWVDGAMAVLTLLGLVLANLRIRTGRYLLLLAAIAGVCAIPVAVPSVVVYYLFGNDVGPATANIAAVIGLILLILSMLVTFNQPYWFSGEARKLPSRGRPKKHDR